VVHLSRRAASRSSRLLNTRTRVIIGKFYPHFSGVLLLAFEFLPVVVLSAARNHKVLQIHPCITNEICLFVVIEDGELKATVIGRIVDYEA
jgi:hypothetical protein